MSEEEKVISSGMAPLPLLGAGLAIQDEMDEKRGGPQVAGALANIPDAQVLAPVNANSEMTIAVETGKGDGKTEKQNSPPPSVPSVPSTSSPPFAPSTPSNPASLSAPSASPPQSKPSSSSPSSQTPNPSHSKDIKPSSSTNKPADQPHHDSAAEKAMRLAAQLLPHTQAHEAERKEEKKKDPPASAEMEKYFAELQTRMEKVLDMANAAAAVFVK